MDYGGTVGKWKCGRDHSIKSVETYGIGRCLCVCLSICMCLSHSDSPPVNNLRNIYASVSITRTIHKPGCCSLPLLTS